MGLLHIAILSAFIVMTCIVTHNVHPLVISSVGQSAQFIPWGSCTFVIPNPLSFHPLLYPALNCFCLSCLVLSCYSLVFPGCESGALSCGLRIGASRIPISSSSLFEYTCAYVREHIVNKWYAIIRMLMCLRLIQHSYTYTCACHSSQVVHRTLICISSFSPTLSHPG